jgi:hypothetical protein
MLTASSFTRIICYISSTVRSILLSRFRIAKFEGLIRMTKYFTWDELPTRDPDTGRLRWAALIKSIQNVSKNVCLFTALYHAVHTTLRIVMYHDFVFEAWYPFDASRSPVYELILLSQART